MSSAMFDDPGDLLYSRLLRRPSTNSPGDSSKFWAEYVQYVNSLGSTKVLGPPRCHNCFQFVFLIIFLQVLCFSTGEAHLDLHALRRLCVIKLTSDTFALCSFLPNIPINEQILSDKYIKKVRKKLGRMTNLRIKLKPNGKNNISWQLTTFSLLKSQSYSRYSEEGPWRGRVQRWTLGATSPRLPLFMARINSHSFSFTSS